MSAVLYAIRSLTLCHPKIVSAIVFVSVVEDESRWPEERKKRSEEDPQDMARMIASETNEMNKSAIASGRGTRSEEEGREREGGEKEIERTKDRGVVVLADDEVALLLSLNTTRGS